MTGVLFRLVAVEHRLDLLRVDIEERDLGALDLQEPADAAVTLAPAAVHRLGQLFESEVGEPHRHPDLAPEPDRERDILVEEAQREIRGVVGAAEKLAEQVESPLAP